jgi:hypothetical protein
VVAADIVPRPSVGAKEGFIVKTEDAAMNQSPTSVQTGVRNARPGLGAVIARIREMDTTLTRIVAGGAAAALRWWMIGREALAESEEDGLQPAKPYVGLHTPDSDAVGPRTDPALQYVDPIVEMSRGRWG